MALSCDDTLKGLSELLARAIDPRAAEELAAHLADCERCRDQAEELVWQDLELAELAGQLALPAMMARLRACLVTIPPPESAVARAVKAETEQTTRTVFSRRLRQQFWGGPHWAKVCLLAVAVMVVVAAGLWLWPRSRAPSGTPPIARLERMEGQVLLLVDDARLPAKAGQGLVAGQGLEVGSESLAVVVCPDSTRFELQAETTVRWAARADITGTNRSGGAPELYVLQGGLTAEVAQQPADRPLVLRTDDAEVVVRGTRLHLSRILDSTHVATEQGLVEVRRLSDRKSVQVPAGFYATIAPRAELAARRLRPPTSDARGIFDQPYGPDRRSVLDLWRAPSSRPTPVVVFIHAGVNHGGDKARVPPALLEHSLKAGISVAAINYRSEDPFPAPMFDAARAVQFLRLRGKEWNLDASRVAAAGEYFGGAVALWIALHDDLAVPAAGDPLPRQSTRLSCVAARSASTSFDPRFLEKTMGDRDARGNPWLLRFLGFGADEWDTPRARRLCEEASPITHASADDPPVFLVYHAGRRPRLPQPLRPNLSWFGEALKERLEGMGGTVRIGYGDDYRRCDCQERMYRDIVQFSLEEFRHP